MRRLSVLLFIAMIAAACCSQANDTIGIYFDSHGLSNCASSGLSTPLSAYLILKQPSAVNGISGWEAIVDWDPGIYVSLTSLSSNGANYASFPSFQVAFPLTPATSDSLVLLATLAVYATQPGALYLRPFSPPSLAGAASPIYADGADPELLVQTVYEFGSAQSPVAYVAANSCPSQPDSSEAATLYADAQVVAMFRPGIVTPAGKSSAQDSFLISSASIRNVLSQYDANILASAIPATTISNNKNAMPSTQSAPLCDRSNIFFVSLPQSLASSAVVRLCDALSAQDGVVFAEPNIAPEPVVDPVVAITYDQPATEKSLVNPTDPYFFDQWYLSNPGYYDIGALAAWDLVTNPSGRVHVAIMDGGFSASGEWDGFWHNDLNDCWNNDRTCWYLSGSDNPPSWSGHAWSVAGIIRACNDYIGVTPINSMAWICDVNVAAIVDGAGTNPPSSQGYQNIYDAFHDALDYPKEAEIYQCAWTWPLVSLISEADANRRYLDLAVSDAYKLNRVVVAAMGNYGALAPARWPAAYEPAVIAVGAVDELGHYIGSNIGPHIDVCAPGSQIRCLGDPMSYGPNCYAETGAPATSAASAIVSGIASLLLDYRNDLYNTDIDAILKYSAEDVTTLPAGPGFDNYTGYGRVRADVAIQSISPPHLYHRMTAVGGAVVHEHHTIGNWKLILQTGDFDAGWYANVERYECDRTITFDYTYVAPPKVWGRPSDPSINNAHLGYYPQTPSYGLPWCMPFSITTTGCILRTYVYYLPSIDKYVPCAPAELEYAFTVLGDPVGTTGADQGNEEEDNATGYDMQVLCNGSGADVKLVLDKSSHVRLDLYDVRGRYLKTMLDGVVTRGVHTVAWDGRDGQGRMVGAGLYFISTSGDVEHVTRRIMIVR